MGRFAESHFLEQERMLFNQYSGMTHQDDVSGCANTTTNDLIFAIYKRAPTLLFEIYTCAPNLLVPVIPMLIDELLVCIPSCVY